MSMENTTDQVCDVVLITGMSGAGRTEAMRVFEDLGYYCVDNLPAPLINQLVSVYCAGSDDAARRSRVAFVCDARTGDFFDGLGDQLDRLDQAGARVRVLFLDADDDKLIARYKSSRRRHPLCGDGASIARGIARERDILHEMRLRATFVIDTTALLPSDLRTKLRELFSSSSDAAGLSVTVYSFGFKHGAPTDADLVIDVRFLPNPYYESRLKHLTGLDAPVRDYVLYNSDTETFMKRWMALLDCVMPGYVSEGKQQLAIAVGCTGGQHRSVALAEATAEYLSAQGYRVSVAHRDLAKALRVADGAATATGAMTGEAAR
ncbi:RNase adapter RapZ [Eggerthellaceae bacterium zg-997]|nr:RNase adapter RapZ [Eggerthellaceae bacterium zg-997]